MLVHRWTLQDRLYAPNNGCNAYLCSLFSCHISSTFYVSIYFSRLFSSLQSFSLWRSDFKSSPEQSFFRLKRKLFVLRLVCLWTKHEYLTMTPRRHQFLFHSGRNDNNLVRIPLISNRPCCSPLLCFGVWNALSLKTKVSSLRDLMLSCSLDLLSVTEWWLTSNDSITIAEFKIQDPLADLTNSLEDYAFCYRT